MPVILFELSTSNEKRPESPPMKLPVNLNMALAAPPIRLPVKVPESGVSVHVPETLSGEVNRPPNVVPVDALPETKAPV